jgi:hypothetical protein
MVLRVSVLLEKVEAAQTLYARTAIIGGFENPLEQCESKCNEEVKSKLLALLRDDERWTT